jgi:Bacterial Ig domain
VKVTDEDGQTVDVIPIEVPISPLNRPPSAQVALQSPDQFGTVRGRVVATDPDGDQLTYGGNTTSRLGGSVSIFSDGTFSYTPDLAVRVAAADRTETKDYFFVAVTEEHGRKSWVRVVIDVPPLTLAPTPVVPPRYPAPPGGDLGGNDGDGSDGGSGGDETPPGPPAGDILNDPNRRGFAVESTIEFSHWTPIFDANGQFLGVDDHYRVTVTAPPADPDGNERFALQIDENGNVSGVAKLLPGQTITGEEIISWDFRSALCVARVTCGAVTKKMAFVEFLPGTFPYDAFPGGTPGPITGPISPDPDGIPDELQQGEREVLGAYVNTCILTSLGATGGGAYLKYGQVSGHRPIRFVQKGQDVITNDLEEELFKAGVESAQNCIDLANRRDET